MITIKDILTKYQAKIDYLDLELIIAHELKKSREFVLAHPDFAITKKQETIIKENINRRITHEPLAYILGQKEFFRLAFAVNKHTLIPRPETELLVEEVLKLKPKNKTIIDIGTGSGNIITSLAKNIKERNNFFAVDISTKALAVSKQNAKLHKVDRKIKFLRGDLLKPFLKNKKLRDTIIVANLPYLDSGWKNLLNSSDTKGLKFEPQIALYAGKDGLDAYRSLARQLEKNNISNSILLCEIGHIQKKEMGEIFSFAKKVEFLKDLADKWRLCKISI